MSFANSYIIGIFFLNIFFVILYTCSIVHNPPPQDDTSKSFDKAANNYDKEEFRKWLIKIQDTTYDGCNINSVPYIDNGQTGKPGKTNKQKILSVVKCSTGKGRWNYRLKVFLGVIH